LTNATRHAEANRAVVRIRDTGGRLVVDVEDDGVGGADITRGTGLRGLADRLAALDGQLEVSGGLAGGTRIRAEIPIR